MIAAREEPRTRAPEPAWVARVRLHAQRRVRWLRHLWSGGPGEAEQWLAISHSEVDRILEGSSSLASLEAAFYRSDPVCAALGRELAAADRRLDEEPRWRRLVDEFQLSGAEADLLCLAAAADLDPSLRRVFAYLQDATAAVHATPHLAAMLFAWAPDAAIHAGTALIGWELAHPADPGADVSGRTTEWIADPSLVRWLTDGDRIGGTDRAVRRVVASDLDCLYPGVRSDIEAFLESLGGPGGQRRAVGREGHGVRVSIDRHRRTDRPARPIEINLVGPLGVGKRSLAADVCGRLGIELLAVDVGAVTQDADGPRPAVERLVRAARMARLSGAAVFWHGLEGIEPPTAARLHGLLPLAFFGGSEPGRPVADPAIARRTFEISGLSRSARTALWSRLSELPPPDPIREWALTPAEITEAATVASAGPAAVLDACGRLQRLAPNEVFSPLATPYTWDDIVLAAPIREHLEEFQAQARLRGSVYDEWGFGRLVPLGRGVTALFAGPSGTGKTMAAQVLARSLDMPLFRVDLSGVMNKYIGETEKRLKLVFDMCERVNVVLLFDEADALFGQRTQVKDAHDRFANIEIDYLLQRMEQFDGIAILATNRKSDMDQAFLRRLRFSIDFLSPGPEERRLLWRRSLPDRSPTGERLLADDLDWEFLSQRLDLSGAAIKAAALGAAFLAMADHSPIGMAHVLHAAGREMTKYAIEARLGEWEG